MVGDIARLRPRLDLPNSLPSLNQVESNQQGMAEGKSRWFCSASMAGFIYEGQGEPEACENGDRNGRSSAAAAAGLMAADRSS